MSLLLLLNQPGTTGGVHRWRVRATDEHGLEGTWSAYDYFSVAHGVAVATVTLCPLESRSESEPVSHWTYYDLDRDVQTHYEVVIANDSGFSDVEQTSGVVSSTHLYHQHTTLADGHYYRRVRVKTGNEWSEWAADDFYITQPISQSSEWDLYEWDGTDLSRIDDAIGGLVVSSRLDGATEFSFTVNNFDGLEAGIADDDQLVLYMRTASGNRKVVSGYVDQKTESMMLDVRCVDVSRYFGKWQVEIVRDNATMGEIITAIIENPSGTCETGIIAHVDECEDPDNPGEPIRFTSWEGKQRSVASVLAEWQKMIGFRWYCTWNQEDAAWHFHWYDPESAPDYTVTLKDDIDYGDESDTEWCVLPGSILTKDRAGYANRVRYRAYYDPPALPPGIGTWDEVWTESSALWGAYTGATVAEDRFNQYPDVGTRSISVTMDIPGPATLPDTYNLGYVRMVPPWRDWRNNYYNALRFAFRLTTYLDGAIYTPPMGQPWMTMRLYDTNQVGPTGGNGIGYDAMGAPIGNNTVLKMSSIPLNIQHLSVDQQSPAGFNSSNVNALGFGLYYKWARGVPPVRIPAGSTYRIRLWLDNIGLHSVSWRWETPGVGTSYVETAEVTAGTEVPITVNLDNRILPQNAARALATRYLALKQETTETLGTLRVVGVRDVPLRTKLNVALTQGPVIEEGYPLVAVTWRPVDARGGWETEFTLGDMPADTARSLESLGYGFKALETELFDVIE